MPGYKSHATGALILGVGSLAAVNWLGWYIPEPGSAVLLMGFVVLEVFFRMWIQTRWGKNSFIHSWQLST